MLLLTGTDFKKTMSDALDVLLCFSFRCFIVFLRKQNYMYRFLDIGVKDEIYLGYEGRFDFLHSEIWYGNYH